MNYLLPCIIGCILLLVTSVARGAADLPGSWSAELQTNSTKLLESGIDAEKLLAMTTTMSKAGFDEQQIIAAQNIIHQASQQGLPSGPIFDKAQEGIVKHVPAPLIVKAMQQVASRYDFAYGTAATLGDDPTFRENLAQVLAAAMAAGIVPTDMEKITDSLQSLAKDNQAQNANLLFHDTLTTSRDLARRGINSGLVGEVITGLLAKGADGREITAIGRTITTQNNRLSANERARLLLSIMATETSVPGLMQALQQNKSFRGNQEAPAGSGASGGHDGTGSGEHGGNGSDNSSGSGTSGNNSSGASGGPGGNNGGNDGSGKSGGSSGSGPAGSASNSGGSNSGGSGNTDNTGSSGGAGSSGRSGK